MMNLPADIQSNLRALTTTIKRNQTGLYSNAIVELVQLLIHYADSEIFFTSNATVTLDLADFLTDNSNLDCSMLSHYLARQ